MTYFTELISKEGETVSHYVHSFESSRDGTTNLKESQWAAAVDLKVQIRSQPEALAEMGIGVYEGEVIVVLSATAISEHDIIKWQNKYFDVLMVEDMYFRKQLDYYKCTCQKRVEFIGS